MTITYKPPTGRPADECAKVLAALKTAGVSVLTLSYDGENDQGGDTDAEAKDGNGAVIDVGAIPTLFPGQPGPCAPQTLIQDCEEVMFDALNLHHTGWEVGDGSKGEFTFAVGTGEMLLTHEWKNEFGEDDEEEDVEGEDA